MNIEVSVDSNVLVYHLAGQPPQFASASTQLFARADAGQVDLYIQPLVIDETIRVLHRMYGVPIADIVTALLPLTTHAYIKMDGMNHYVAEALNQMLLHPSRLDFVDAYLGSLSALMGTRVATYNTRDFKLIPGARPVLPDKV